MNNGNGAAAAHRIPKFPMQTCEDCAVLYFVYAMPTVILVLQHFLQMCRELQRNKINAATKMLSETFILLQHLFYCIYMLQQNKSLRLFYCRIYFYFILQAKTV